MKLTQSLSGSHDYSGLFGDGQYPENSKEKNERGGCIKAIQILKISRIRKMICMSLGQAN